MGGPRSGARYLWCASSSASAPHDLVTAFASSLASPAPVPRHTVPESAAGGSLSSAATDSPCPRGSAVVRLVADLPEW
ncbi:DUF317 domain-containing protein [Streptomyces sp. NPDC054844]